MKSTTRPIIFLGCLLSISGRLVSQGLDPRRFPMVFEPAETETGERATHPNAETDRARSFFVRGPGYGLQVDPAGLTYLFPATSTGAASQAYPGKVRMTLLGANPNSAALLEEPLPGRANYFVGADPLHWRLRVPTFRRVGFTGVYPGIDVLYYGHHGRLEFDFVVAPGADPGQVCLHIDGIRSLGLASDGSLVIETPAQRLVWPPASLYQEFPGGRRPVEGRYLLRGDGKVGFTIGPYDVARELIIDPVLMYSTFLGGNSADWGGGLALDADGNTYLTGWTWSTSQFPGTGAGFQTDRLGQTDGFVMKLDANNRDLVYATYLGGTSYEAELVAVAVDSQGCAYVTGGTASADFPVTEGAAQGKPGSQLDVFVAKLDPSGSSLVYSTYLAGNGHDESQGIALDASGNAYVTGRTASTDWPVTTGTRQTRLAGGFDAFITKLSSSGSLLYYSTFLGGTGDEWAHAIVLDQEGRACVGGYTRSPDFPVTAGAQQTGPAGGSDGFLACLSPDGSTAEYASYFGGSGNDHGRYLALDDQGFLYLAGNTNSDDLPVSAGAYQGQFAGEIDGFLAKIDFRRGMLVYGTYLGGKGYEIVRALAVDEAGQAYLAGATQSWDFPTTIDAVQRTHGGQEDGFVAKLSPDGQVLTYGTLLGGSASDRIRGLAIDDLGNAHVTGFTGSADFPVRGALQPTYLGGTSAACWYPLDLENYIVGEVDYRYIGSCDAFYTVLATENISMSLTSSTDHVQQGRSIPFQVKIQNATDETRDLVLQVVRALPDGSGEAIGGGRLSVPSGRVFRMNAEFPIPPGGPDGTWKLIANLYTTTGRVSSRGLPFRVSAAPEPAAGQANNRDVRSASADPRAHRRPGKHKKKTADVHPPSLPSVP